MKKRRSSLLKETWPAILLTGVTLMILLIMTQAIQDADDFAQSYVVLLAAVIIGVLVMMGMIGRQLYLLIQQRRKHTSTTSITLRLLRIVAGVTLIPLFVVFAFALTFINQGIDSWFNIKTESALQSAMDLSRASIDQKRRESLKQVQNIADSKASDLIAEPSIVLNEMRLLLNAHEMALFNSNGQAIASSSSDLTIISPESLDTNVLQQIRQITPFTQYDTNDENFSSVEIVVPLQHRQDVYGLRARFEVPKSIDTLTQTVAQAYEEHQRLALLKSPLKATFLVSLLLVALLASLSATLVAIHLSRRFTQPIRHLAFATKQVSQGNYATQLQNQDHDELGFLVDSFNEMTQQISLARNRIQSSQQNAETQRAFFETILKHLSSGVWVCSSPMVLRTYNTSAETILNTEFSSYQYLPISHIAHEQPSLKPLIDLIMQNHVQGKTEWQAQIQIETEQRTLTLSVQGTTLPDFQQKSAGMIIVFDDISQLMQAQRTEAWSEVARRLAHEIKNPLTPIQLSAERLQYKLSSYLQDEEKSLLTKSTDTIISHVESLKNMVQTFNDFARMPSLQLQKTALVPLINSTTELYLHKHNDYKIELELEDDLPELMLDPTQIRQVLHNLIKNAIEACESIEQPIIQVKAQRIAQTIELSVCDNGIPINKELRERLFEPYATSKPKGTGLGLAIVKRIIEEHQGTIELSNGAEKCFTLTLPIQRTAS